MAQNIGATRMGPRGMKARDTAVAWAVVAFVALATAVAPTPGAAAEGDAPGQAAQAPTDAPRRISLGEAVRAAAATTPAVRIAGYKTDAAGARVGEARAGLLPNLSGNAFVSNRTFNLRSFGIEFPSAPGAASLPDRQGPVGDVDARFTVTQTLFDFATWRRMSAAGEGVEVSRAEADAASEGSSASAALAYLAAARANALVTAREADAALAGDLLGVAEAQLKAGVGANIDVTRARTQLAVSRAQLVVAINQRDRSQIGLARALGLDPAQRFDLADTLSDTIAASDVSSDSATILTTALARRPELRTERLKLRRAQADRSAIEAERLPRLQAEADYGLSGQVFPDAFPTRQVSLALSMPILDGWRRESRIAEQRSVVRESEARAHDLEDQIAGEVRGAMLDIASAREQEKIAAEQVALAEEEVSEARDRFVGGIAGNIEVINAQASLIHARDAQINARHASAVARVMLARAAGAAGTVH